MYVRERNNNSTELFPCEQILRFNLARFGEPDLYQLIIYSRRTKNIAVLLTAFHSLFLWSNCGGYCQLNHNQRNCSNENK